MRMHKKPHLEERISACSKVVTVADLSDKNMLSSVQKKEYLQFNKIFGNDNPVHLEIGCGKGKFVLEMARLHPSVNFIALEKITNVIIDGCEKLLKEPLNNVYFLNASAEVLQKYFPNGSVERIYLNFSNPLPKMGYAKQRLTHPKFLQIYRNILTANGEIWQKTDNEDFYNFSVESYGEENYKIISTCRDLKNNPFDGNVVTEHEQRFTDMGLPIFRIVARV
ncbi:MAG: tRNA (guanosine(46)-N7)-methyltransferase TrmB [Clostridiales bacterium]|nr:tRNA (guanosine(46)-N7)-methyltransferase TrmB [Clostridiales bacterium]